MKVYEFWLKEEFKAQAFEAIVDSFNNIGGTLLRKVDNEVGPPVYSVSRNQESHWVQILVDDNTPQGILTAIEARINGLKDETESRSYQGENDNVAPMEREK